MKACAEKNPMSDLSMVKWFILFHIAKPVVQFTLKLRAQTQCWNDTNQRHDS